MIAVFIISGFVAAGFTIGLIATATAPVGYEDETGFHFGEQHGQGEEQFPCVVPQPKAA